MRKFLFQGLLRPPLTEPVPVLDDAMVAELGECSCRAIASEGSAAACRSARLTPDRAMAANSKSTRSATHFMISNDLDCVSSRRRDTPTFSW